MQCERARLELVAYVRGDLPSQERADVEAHLSTCPLCAEEAVAMRGLGITVQRGLKHWVDEGDCPPEVLARIELAIRGAARRPWWRTWQASVGAVAAVAAVFFVLLSTRPEFAHQIATVPLLGSIAAQFMTPDLDVQVAALSTESVVQQKPRRVIELDVVSARDDIILALKKVEVGDALTRLHYVVRGVAIDKQVAATAYQPQLIGPTGVVALRGYSASQRKDFIEFTATFDPISTGQAFTLTLASIPEAITQSVRWSVTGDKVEGSAGSPDSFGITLVAWIRQDNHVMATVQWPEGKALHLTGWTAVDTNGKSYAVREYGRPVLASGNRIEQVVVDLPPGAPRITLTAGQVVKDTQGPWQVSFSN